MSYHVVKTSMEIYQFQKMKNSDAAFDKQIKDSASKIQEQATKLQQTKSDLQATNNNLQAFKQQTSTSIGQLTSEGVIFQVFG